MLVRRRGFGEYAAGAFHSTATYRLDKSTIESSGVLAAYSHAGTDLTFLDGGTPELPATTRALVAARKRVASFAVGSDWGNAAAVTRVANLHTYATQTLNFVERVGIVAASGGALPALNWAKDNPSKWSAIALLIPAIDLQDVHTNNRGGHAASIEVAHGGAPPDSHNPADNAASFAGKPIKIWYSTDDPLCVSATMSAFAATSGAELRSLGSIGHALTGLDTDEVLSFLDV